MMYSTCFAARLPLLTWWLGRSDLLLQSNATSCSEQASTYAATICKAQGSQCPTVVIPVGYPALPGATQLDHLIYTGITRAKRLLVTVGQREALGLAVRNDH